MFRLIFRFSGYFSQFLGFGVILVICFMFRGCLGHFLNFRGILVIF